jgi:hypothetical protein
MAVEINRYQNMISPQPALNRVEQQNPQILDNSGKAAELAGEMVGQYSQELQKKQLTRDKANQELWLIGQEAQNKVAAKQIYDNAANNAQMGGSIKETVEKEWSLYSQKQQEKTKDNPYLNTLYAEQLARIKTSVDLQSEEWESKEKTRYTMQAAKDAAANMQRSWDELPDAGSLNKKSQEDMVSLNRIIESAELEPSEKERLREIVKKDMPNGVMSIMTRKYPRMVAAFGGGNFNYAVNQVLTKEGGYVANDAGNGETNFGINKTANPDVDVKNLTKEKATELYRERYWNSIGADSLSPDLAYVAFDAAVNQGVGATKDMLKKANGDIDKFVQLREERYKEVAKNPEKAPFLEGWLKRNNDTLQEASGISAYKMGTLEQRINWREQAEREIAAQEAESKRQLALGESYIKTIESRQDAGKDIPDVEYKNIQQLISSINNPALNQKWAETTAKADAQKQYFRMTPPALQEYINTTLQPLTVQNGATPLEFAKLNIAEKTLKTMTTMAKENPLGLMQKAGQEVPALDFTQPASLLNRLALAKNAASSEIPRDANGNQLLGGYAVPLSTAFFQPAEKGYIDGYLAKESTEKQLELAKSFVDGMGQDAADVVSVFNKSAPEFSYAVGIMSVTPGLVDVAKEILMGAKAIKTDPKLAPSQKLVDASLTEWEGYFGTPAQYSAAKNAGIALYVARNGGKSFDGEVLTSAMKDAIGGERATINGVNTITPPGINKDMFETWVQTLTKERLNELSNNANPTYKDKDGMPRGMYDFKNDKIKLRSIGGSQYQLMSDKNTPVAGSGKQGTVILTIRPEDVLKDAEIVKAKSYDKEIRMKSAYLMGM